LSTQDLEIKVTTLYFQGTIPSNLYLYIETKDICNGRQTNHLYNKKEDTKNSFWHQIHL